MHSVSSHINSSALSKRIFLYLQVQVFWCVIIFIESKEMDATCAAINLIYLIICFLPFYVTVSLHFSLLFLYSFLSFFSPLLLFLFSPSCNAYTLSSSNFGVPHLYFIFYLPLVYICPLILLFVLFGFAIPPSPPYFST